MIVALRAVVTVLFAVVACGLSIAPAFAQAPQPNRNLDMLGDEVKAADWVKYNVEGAFVYTVYTLDRGVLVNLLYRSPTDCIDGKFSEDSCRFTAPRILWRTFDRGESRARWFGDVLRSAQEKYPEVSPVALIVNTPAFLSYQNTRVVDLMNQMIAFCRNTVLVYFFFLLVRTFVVGLNNPGKGTKHLWEAIQRLVLGLALIYALPLLASLSVELSNYVVDAITTCDGHACQGSASALVDYRPLFSLYDYARVEELGDHLLPEYVMALNMYAFAVLGLTAMMFLRIVFLDVLLIVGPLFMLMWVNAETKRFGTFWAHTFATVVLMQPILAIVLSVATALFVGNAAIPSTSILKLLLATGTIVSAIAVIPALQKAIFQNIDTVMQTTQSVAKGVVRK